MSEIKILHLSDLHYESTKPRDVQIILDALWKDLESFEGIDFIVFSGDLVKAGDKKQDFDAALEVFIEPLLKKTGLSPNEFFIAPGNHDIQQSKIDPFREDGLRRMLSSREQVNDFFDQEIETGFQSILRLDNFNTFKQKFHSGLALSYNKLFSTHAIEKGEKRVGIACLSSCWRATGIGSEHDRGKLLIGERQIRTAADDIKDCDIKIAVYHHPLDWLKKEDKAGAQKLLSREFNFAFCGHLHDANIQFVQNFAQKSVLIQGGSLNKGRKHPNCYSVLSLDMESKKGYVYLRTYYDDRDEFDQATNLVEGGRVDIDISQRKEPRSQAKRKKTSPEDKKKGIEAFERGKENLESQHSQQALKEFKTASELLPGDENAQLYYRLSLLTVSPMLEIDMTQMNEIVETLKTVTEGTNKKRVNIARLLLAVIWIDYYMKNNYNYREDFFQENYRYLKGYRPSDDEKKIFRLINPSETAKILFDLNEPGGKE